jgi:hypothetical protein
MDGNEGNDSVGDEDTNEHTNIIDARRLYADETSINDERTDNTNVIPEGSAPVHCHLRSNAENPYLHSVHHVPEGLRYVMGQLRQQYPIVIPSYNDITWIHIQNAGEMEEENFKRWTEVRRAIGKEVEALLLRDKVILTAHAREIGLYCDRNPTYKYPGVTRIKSRNNNGNCFYKITVGRDRGGKGRAPVRIGNYDIGMATVAQFLSNVLVMNNNTKVGTTMDLKKKGPYVVQKQCYNRIRSPCRTVDTIQKVDVMNLLLELELDCLGPLTHEIDGLPDEWWAELFSLMVDYINHSCPGYAISKKT